jgi:hypothetical protein
MTNTDDIVTCNPVQQQKMLEEKNHYEKGQPDRFLESLGPLHSAPLVQST